MKRRSFFLSYVCSFGLSLAMISCGSSELDSSNSLTSSRSPRTTLFFESLSNEREIPFVAAPGQLSRLSMIAEMGRKYPGMDCSHQCDDSVPYKNEACQYGLLGATYILTGFQYKTARSQIDIWQTPNSSLNIGAYSFMVEREQGIPCSRSKYIKKWPTRAPEPGESRAPITHVEVCRAWNRYFDAASGPVYDLSDKPKPTFRMRGGRRVRIITAKDRRWLAKKKKVDAIQKKLWDAHTKAILHSYWQYAEILRYGPHVGVPQKEYELWMGWNRIVGNWIPQQNYNSCVEGAEFLAYMLMPDCIVGNKDGFGNDCKGTLAPESGLGDAIKGMQFGFAQELYKTTDFSLAIDAFLTTIDNAPYKNYQSPY